MCALVAVWHITLSAIAAASTQHLPLIIVTGLSCLRSIDGNRGTVTQARSKKVKRAVSKQPYRTHLLDLFPPSAHTLRGHIRAAASNQIVTSLNAKAGLAF